uniref:tRNA epoxyqueuosine(34) reductase QueG n=1 Tax=Alistipes sp. TaxID=1872444 RepID=UPI004055BBA0
MIPAFWIKEQVKEEGFELCGIVPGEPLVEPHAHFTKWLKEGRHASLSYLERNIDKRFDPSLLMPETRSIVVCGLNYRNRHSGQIAPSPTPKIASYALMRDYHLTIKEMLHKVASRLKANHPALRLRLFTDSAPLAEKSLAVKAGLGWQGRNSLVITPQFGSYILLGELLLSEEVDHYDSPYSHEQCGNCRRCIEACPNGAIMEDRTIDARRCIACHTIERGEGSPESSTHGWLFGCELCQAACPHNRFTPESHNPALSPLFSPTEWPKERWLALSDEEFKSLFGSTPLTRCGLEHLKKQLRQP